MNVISSSAGNDSLAMIQWAIERNLPDLHVVFCDTGWQAAGWMTRVHKIHSYAESHNIKTPIVKSIGMEELVRIKKGFPANAQQFCTAHLKGVQFLEWIDETDKD